MKKILSLGIASAVLALTAVSASAAVVVKTDSKVVTGETITVDFVTDQAMNALQFSIDAAGLEYVSHAASTGIGLASYNTETKKFGFANTAEVASGTTVLTVTYRVTAAAGAPVSVNVKDITGGNGTVSATIQTNAEAANSGNESSTPSGNESSTPSGNESSTPSGNESSTPSTSSSTDPGTNPPTGVALAVFPAVIAGAAVVVAKKKRG